MSGGEEEEEKICKTRLMIGGESNLIRFYREICFYYKLCTRAMEGERTSGSETSGKREYKVKIK